MEAKHTATYIVTAELQEDSVKQYFWRVMFRPRIFGLLALAALLIVASLLDDDYRPWVVGFLAASLFVLTVAWTKTYFMVIRQAKAGLRLMEHPNVEISFDDSMIEYSSSTGTRRHRWDKIDTVRETRDFLILMSGKLPLLSLPKSCFSDEAIRFLKDHAEGVGEA